MLPQNELDFVKSNFIRTSCVRRVSSSIFHFCKSPCCLPKEMGGLSFTSACDPLAYCVNTAVYSVREKKVDVVVIIMKVILASWTRGSRTFSELFA